MATRGSVVGVVGSRRRASLHAHRVFLLLLSVVVAAPLLFAGGHSRLPRRESLVARHFGMLTNDKALELINENDDCVVVDVRLRGEQIEFGHLQAKAAIPTVNIPVDFADFPFEEERFMNIMKIKLPDTHLKLLVSCTEGIRSKKVAKVLEKYSYRNVYDLCEGVIGWREDGFPVIPLKGHEEGFEPTGCVLSRIRDGRVWAYLSSLISPKVCSAGSFRGLEGPEDDVATSIFLLNCNMV